MYIFLEDNMVTRQVIIGLLAFIAAVSYIQGNALRECVDAKNLNSSGYCDYPYWNIVALSRLF